MALVILILGAAYVALAAALAWWTLEPINRVAGQLQLSTRFALTDFLGLMVMLQAPLAAAGRAIDNGGDRDNSSYWILLGLATLLVVILWMAAVSVASRAGITRLWRRLCVIVLLVPGTLGLIVLWPIGLSLLIAWLTTLQVQAGSPTWGWGVFLVPALVCLTVLLRSLSFWALVGSPGEEVLFALQRARLTPEPTITMPAPPAGAGHEPRRSRANNLDF